MCKCGYKTIYRLQEMEEVVENTLESFMADNSFQRPPIYVERFVLLKDALLICWYVYWVIHFHQWQALLVFMKTVKSETISFAKVFSFGSGTWGLPFMVFALIVVLLSSWYFNLSAYCIHPSTWYRITYYIILQGNNERDLCFRSINSPVEQDHSQYQR